MEFLEKDRDRCKEEADDVYEAIRHDGARSEKVRHAAVAVIAPADGGRQAEEQHAQGDDVVAPAAEGG